MNKGVRLFNGGDAQGDYSAIFHAMRYLLVFALGVPILSDAAIDFYRTHP